MPFSAVLTATVLVSAFSSIMMGVYAKNPIMLAPGMGLNAFFAYSVVQGMGVSWQTALGAVFWSGIIFLLLSVFNIRTQIVRAIPAPLRLGVAAGIGLFISLIGLVHGGFVAAHPATLVSRGPLTPSVWIFLGGLGLSAILLAYRVKGSLILGILFTTLAAVSLGRLWGAETAVNWNGLWAPPDFSLIFQLDLPGSLKLGMVPVIFAFLFTDMFDSLSTFVGVAEAGDLKDADGQPRNVKESLIVDAVSTTISGLLGTSSGTSYIESAVGIAEGGRSGWTAIVTGLLFLPFMFLSPLLSMVPAIATAPALVLVGVFMMKPVRAIQWENSEEAIPAFLSLILIPLTYSITQGIIWGFLSWTLIKVFRGKFKEISPMLWIIDGFSILALFV
jgi:AGZA family xanthine/uracil permease-like MFS transporter